MLSRLNDLFLYTLFILLLVCLIWPSLPLASQDETHYPGAGFEGPSSGQTAQSDVTTSNAYYKGTVRKLSSSEKDSLKANQVARGKGANIKSGSSLLSSYTGTRFIKSATADTIKISKAVRGRAPATATSRQTQIRSRRSWSVHENQAAYLFPETQTESLPGNPSARELNPPAPFRPAPQQTQARKSIFPNATAGLPYTLRNTNRAPLNLPLRRPLIVVEKSLRNLIVYDNGVEVRRYGIMLGPVPEGGKRVQGDGKTPEGRYFICSKNGRSRFFLNLGINYPNESDAARGLRDGLISRRDYQRIANAERTGTKPPWNTPLGGAIVIHGEDVSNGDWTQGCIALRDADMAELYDIIAVGTPIQINW